MESNLSANELFEKGIAAIGGDNEYAFACFEKAAQAGHAEAMQRLADCLQYGLGTRENPVLAAVWSARAKAAGFDPDAPAKQDDPLLADYQTAVQQAKQGDAAAAERRTQLEQQLLDRAQAMFSDSNSTPEQLAQSAEQVKLLADSGLARAQWLYGSLLESGRGVRQNVAAAAKWFRMAAEGGYAMAQVQIGMYLQYGYGMDQDPDAALAWYEKAAAQGDPYGYQQLGCYYYCGSEEQEPDYEKAVPLLKKAAEAQMPQALALMGDAYLYGNGVEQDDFIAIDYLKAAADLGHEQAAELLLVFDLR